MVTHIDNSWSLFLDRDGVINKYNDYPPSVFRKFEWLNNSDEALVSLSKLFKYIFVVTNQSGIALKYTSKSQIDQLHRDVQSYVRALGGDITEFFVCPHLPRYQCKCRKPKPKMAFDAKRLFSGVDFKKSIMVGDRKTDMEFGQNLGMKTILISEKSENYNQDLTFKSLKEFSDYLNQSIHSNPV